MLSKPEGIRVAALVLAMFVAGCGGGSSSDTDASTQGTLLLGNPNPNPNPSQNPTGGSQQPGTPPEPAVSCRVLTQCLNLEQAAVANFKGGKKAAASYTFDDGYDSSFVIADLFEARGLRASFYIVASMVPDEEWARWRGLIALGHEVGNHSMTHRIDLGMPETTEAQLNTEITEAQNLLTTGLGVKPEVFAFPWHSSTPAARALALKTHLAIRTSTEELPFTLAFFDQDHGTPEETMTTVNQQLAETVQNGGWYVAAGHGTDGDGWSPVTHEFLNQHLDYAKGFSNDLWTDTYLNVARYQICRKQAALQVDYSSSAQVKLKLSGTFNPACTEPLSVKIPALVGGMPAVVARDASGAQLQMRRKGGAVIVDVMPGQTVTLSGQ